MLGNDEEAQSRLTERLHADIIWYQLGDEFCKAKWPPFWTWVRAPWHLESIERQLEFISWKRTIGYRMLCSQIRCSRLSVLAPWRDFGVFKRIGSCITLCIFAPPTVALYAVSVQLVWMLRFLRFCHPVWAFLLLLTVADVMCRSFLA